MLKRSQTRTPRARLARPLSSTLTGHAFIFLGALLLLVSVAFLQLKLGSLGSSFRRDRHLSKPASPRRGPLVSSLTHPSSRIKPKAGPDDAELGGSGSRGDRSALEVREARKEDMVSALDSSPNETNGADEDDSDADSEEDGEKVDESEMDMELEAEENDEADNSGDVAAGDSGTEDEEAAGKEQLSQGSEAGELKASTDDQGLERNGTSTLNNQISSMENPDKLEDRILKQHINDSNALSQHLGNAREAENDTLFTQQIRTDKALTRLEGIKSIPRWDWQEMQPEKSRSAHKADSGRFQTSLRRVGKEKQGVVWDHFLGVARTTSSKSVLRKFGIDTAHRNGSLPDVGCDNKQEFGSDDMPVDEDIRQQLEKIATVEDALLLKGDKLSARNGFWTFLTDNSVKKFSKSDISRKEKPGKLSLDPLYPFNNPLLQDPDTYGPSGLTKSDKAILKALRKDMVIEDPEQHMMKQEASSDLRLADASKSQGIQVHAVEFLSDVKVDQTALNGSEHGMIAMVSRQDGALQNESSVGNLDKQGQVGNLNQYRGRRLNGFNGSEREFIQTQEDSQLHTLDKSDSMNDNAAKEENLAEINPNLILASDNSDILQTTGVLERYGNEIMGASSDSYKSRITNIDMVAEIDDVHSSLNSKSLATSRLVMQNMGTSFREESLHQMDVKFSRIEYTHLKPQLCHDRRKWGFFPGLDPCLSFSDFLEKFLYGMNCSLRVFMAWMTPPWSYTIRHQRGLESIFYVHPDACVVVFSESIELDFFNAFVADGYKVSVVIPNLEELLRNTPADIFAEVWLNWRKIPLYYLHYTELLRLAALYKYGGIYLDSDIIVIKPLNHFHNVIGLESLANNEQALNGAVMTFNKSSSFLLECLKEFTATYDDQLIDWNGAGLLKRVVNITSLEKSRYIWDLKIEPHFSFFPISSEDIVRYFTAPGDNEQQEQEVLFQMILARSYTVHFWAHLTASVVPETGSLMEKVINHHCLRCKEYL